ncbi:MAG: hypothetical protein HQL13_02330 [Candidatus Omnitrophica bacterium]|nr:hypothetical protein [Candidatus Omnitrophota bacterium]
MKKKINRKSNKKTEALAKSLQGLMKDEDGFVSKETILKVGLSTVAALGVAGALIDVTTGQNCGVSSQGELNNTSHNNTVSQPDSSGCVTHHNVTTHTSY